MSPAGRTLIEVPATADGLFESVVASAVSQGVHLGVTAPDGRPVSGPTVRQLRQHAAARLREMKDLTRELIPFTTSAQLIAYALLDGDAAARRTRTARLGLPADIEPDDLTARLDDAELRERLVDRLSGLGLSPGDQHLVIRGIEGATVDSLVGEALDGGQLRDSVLGGFVPTVVARTLGLNIVVHDAGLGKTFDTDVTAPDALIVHRRNGRFHGYGAPLTGSADPQPLPPDLRWLPLVNPARTRGAEGRGNCVLVATVVDDILRTGEPQAAPPTTSSAVDQLLNYAPGTMFVVPGRAALTDLMSRAGTGARGIVVVNTPGRAVSHAFNVVNHDGEVRYLDGTSGRYAVWPPDAYAYFLPTALPGDVEPAWPVHVPDPTDLAGAAPDQAAEVEPATRPDRLAEVRPAARPDPALMEVRTVVGDGDCLFQAVRRSAQLQNVALPPWVPPIRPGREFADPDANSRFRAAANENLRSEHLDELVALGISPEDLLVDTVWEAFQRQRSAVAEFRSAAEGITAADLQDVLGTEGLAGIELGRWGLVVDEPQPGGREPDRRARVTALLDGLPLSPPEYRLVSLILGGAGLEAIIRTALTDTEMWQTHAADHLVDVMGRLLGLNVVVRERDHTNQVGLEPAAENRPWLVLHRNGVNHYDALAPTESEAPVAAPAEDPSPPPKPVPGSTPSLPEEYTVVRTPRDGYSMLYAVLATTPHRVRALGGFDRAQSAWLTRMCEAGTPKAMESLLREAQAREVAVALARRLARILGEPVYEGVLDRLVRAGAPGPGSPSPAERRRAVRAVRQWQRDRAYQRGFAEAVAEILARPLEVRSADSQGDWRNVRVGRHRYAENAMLLQHTGHGHYDAVFTEAGRNPLDTTVPEGEGWPLAGQNPAHTALGAEPSRSVRHRALRAAQRLPRLVRTLTGIPTLGQPIRRVLFEVRTPATAPQPSVPRVSSPPLTQRRERWPTLRRLVLPRPPLGPELVELAGARLPAEPGAAPPPRAMLDAGTIVARHLAGPPTGEQVARALSTIRLIARDLAAGGDAATADVLAREILGRDEPVPGSLPYDGEVWHVPVPGGGRRDTARLPRTGWQVRPEGYLHPARRVLVSPDGRLLRLPEVADTAPATDLRTADLSLVDGASLFFEVSGSTGLRHTGPLRRGAPASPVAVPAELRERLRAYAVPAGTLLTAGPPTVAELVAAADLTAPPGPPALITDPRHVSEAEIRAVAAALGIGVVRVPPAARVTPDLVEALRQPPEGATGPGLDVVVAAEALTDHPSVGSGFIGVARGSAVRRVLPELAADLVFAAHQRNSGTGPERQELPEGWVAEQTPDGLWIRPGNVGSPANIGRRAPGRRARVVIGPPDQPTPVPATVQTAVADLLRTVAPGMPVDLVVHGMPRWRAWTGANRVDIARDGVTRHLTPTPSGFALHARGQAPARPTPALDSPGPVIEPDHRSADPAWLRAALDQIHPRVRSSVVLDLRRVGAGLSPAVMDELAALVDGRVLTPSPAPDRAKITPAAPEAPRAEAKATPAKPESTPADLAAPEDEAAAREKLAGMAAASLAVRGVGIPRSHLPGVDRLVEQLRTALAGQKVPDADWSNLPQFLLSNYGSLVTGGYRVRLGDAEVHVSLDLHEPRVEVDATPVSGVEGRTGQPRPKGIESTKGVFQTGGHSGGQSGQASAVRFGLGVSAGFGIGPGALQAVRAGVGLSVVANSVTRGTSHVNYAEVGHVLDVRDTQSYVSYAVRLRAEIVLPRPRRPLPPPAPPEPIVVDAADRIDVAIPWQYLQPAPAGLIRARPEGGVDPAGIPPTFFTVQLTGLQPLADGIVRVLESRGVNVAVGTQARADLYEGFRKMALHLDRAVEGHSFWLTESGRRIAQVTVRARRTEGGDRRLGVASDKAHIERVRTAVVGEGNSQSIDNSITPAPFVEASVVPVPGLSLGPKLELPWTIKDADSIDTSRASLRVQVSRDVGMTAAHELDLVFEASVTAENFAHEVIEAGRAEAKAVVAVPEAEAFRHGMQVDREAFAGEPVDGKVPYDPAGLRFAGQDDQPEQRPPLPAHVRDGLLGQSLVRLERDAHRPVLQALTEELTRKGFLVPRPVLPFQAGPGQRRHVNAERLSGLVSAEAFESMLPQMLTDGTPFTVSVNDADGTLRQARVTLRARFRPDPHQDHWLRRTAGIAVVYLSMGTAGHGQNMIGQHKLGVGGALAFGVTKVPWIKSFGTALKWERFAGAIDRSATMTNKPTLMEYPGRTDEYVVPLELWATVEYDDGSPMFDTAAPAGPSVTPATLHVLPHFHEPDPAVAVPQEIHADVLNQAVLPYVDTRDLVTRARLLLPELTGPGGPLDQEISNFLSPFAVLANLTAIVEGRYSRQLFAPGLLREKIATLTLTAIPHDMAYGGSTPDKYVLGLIDLILLTGTQTDSRGSGWSYEAPRLRSGGSVGSPGLSDLAGAAGLSFRHGTSRSLAQSRTAGREYLNLDFNDADAFFGTMTFVLSIVYERSGKLAPNTVRRADPQYFPDRRFMAIFPKPTTMALYGNGQLALPPDTLAAVLGKWSSREQPLPGSVVAAALARWEHDQRTAPEPDTYGDQRRQWAGELAGRLTSDKRLSVEPAARQRFEAMFGLLLPRVPDPYADLVLPQYLTANLFGPPGGPDRGPQPNPLGLAVLEGFTLDGARSLIDIVHDAIDRVHPGALAQQAQSWVEHTGPVSGKLQGGLEMLEATFAGDRSWPLLSQMASVNGYSIAFYVPHGAVGYVLKVNVKAGWLSRPRVVALLTKTGIENYHHAHTSSSSTTGKSRGWTAGNPALSLSGEDTVRPGETEDKTADLRGGLSATISAGQSRSTTRTDVTSAEQTSYAYDGGYVLEGDVGLTVTVSRHDRDGRPVMNAIAGVLADITNRPQDETQSATGQVRMRVPREMMEATPVPPSLDIDLSPAGPLPGDAVIHAVVTDDAVAVAQRLVAGLPSGAGEPDLLPTSLQATLTATGLAGYLPAALQEHGLVIGDHLHEPGSSAVRSTLTLHAELFDVHALSTFDGAGTGRYAKGQSGVSSNISTDRWAVSFGASGGGDPTVHVEDRENIDKGYGKHGLSPTLSGGHSMAVHENAGDASNVRAEDHLKQLGTTVLVRARLRGHFTAERRRVTTAGTFRTVGTTRSDHFGGEVFLQMPADEFERFRGTAPPAPPLTTPVPPAVWERARQVDLDAQFDARSMAEPDGGFALGRVAQRIRAGLAPGEPVVLTTAQSLRDRTSREAVLGWARESIARVAGPVDEAIGAEIARWSARPAPDVTRPDAEHLRELVERVLRDAPNGREAPTFPPLAWVDERHLRGLAALIAWYTGSPVRLALVDPDGTIRRFDVDGRRP